MSELILTGSDKLLSEQVWEVLGSRPTVENQVLLFPQVKTTSSLLVRTDQNLKKRQIWLERVAFCGQFKLQMELASM